MKIIKVVALSAAILALAVSCASRPAKSAPDATPQAATPAAAPQPAVAAAPSAAQPAAPASVVDLAQYASASKACYAVLEKAAALAAQGKWKSAVAAIDEFDMDSEDPFALALKTSLLLKGAVGNDADRSFAVVDLEPGQDLDALRQAGGEYALVAFDPPALAAAQSSKGVAAPPILSITLGDYYYDALVNFQDQWEISPYEIAGKVADHYKAGFGGGLYIPASLRKQTEVLSVLEFYEEAVPVYQKLLALEPKDPLSHYGYALVLQKLNKPAEMLVELDRAIEDYGDSEDRLGVVALASKTASELGDAAKAEAYLAKTDKELAGKSLAGMLRHFVAVSLGNRAAAEAAAGKLVDEYGTDAAVVRDMIVIWYQAGQAADARSFLEKRIPMGGKSLAVANLEFYLAVLLMQDDMPEADRAAAKIALDDAEKRMKEALPPEDPIFASIASVREALTPPAPVEGTGGAEGSPKQESAPASTGAK